MEKSESNVAEDTKDEIEDTSTEKTKLIESSPPINYSKENGVKEKMELDLDYTFWLMKKRQYQRVQRGVVNKPRSSYTILWFLFLTCLYGSYLGLRIGYEMKREGYILEFILMGLLSFGIAIMIPRFHWMSRLLLLESYGFFYIFFVNDLYYKPHQYFPLGGGIAGAMLFTMIGFVIYPYILRCYIACSGTVHPRLTPKDKEEDPGSRIEIITESCCSTSLECVYQGHVRNGKPDGYGAWIDTSAQGEFLQGWWSHGVPIGPFESLENGTRSMLVNLRLFFATNAGGRFWTERIGLHYGVASVECCVTGHFFNGYPKVDMLYGPKKCECQQICRCSAKLMKSKYWRHLDDARLVKSVTVSVDKNNLMITGHKSKRSRVKKVEISLEKTENKVPHLVLDENWIKGSGTEVMLFLHGYDHDLKDSLKRFGQFLALGHFPPHIKPFVFNWPSSSSPLFYWCAHSVASDNDVHRDLKDFLISLKEAGVKQLHVMCHSMGSRFFLRAFSTIKELFALKLMSPRGSVHEDLHLLDASKLSTQDSFTQGIQLSNLIFMNPDYELETFKNDYYELDSYASKITIYADHRDEAVRMSFKMTSKPSLGNNITPLVDKYGKLLDIDLIDTGDLDRNTNNYFHSFFNVNRLMVDDLHELILTGKRAEERNSRLKRWGYVYRFTILPSSVVMV